MELPERFYRKKVAQPRVIRASLDTNRPTPYWDVYHRAQPNPNGDDDSSRQTTSPATTAAN
jgi:hypothetical protein